MSNNEHLTPIQKKMLAILGDGQPHAARELHGCLGDEAQPVSNVTVHLTGIRKLVRSGGDDVVTITALDGTFYQLRRRMGRRSDE